MDASKVEGFVSQKWDDEIVPQLVEYIRIPNKSPMFDTDWVKNGYMDQAVTLMETWARAQPVPGMTLEVVRLEWRAPRPSLRRRSDNRHRRSRAAATTWMQVTTIAAMKNCECRRP